MATTITTDLQDTRPSGVYSSIWTSSAVTMGWKVSTDAAPANKTLFANPSGRILLVHKIYTGNSDNLSDDNIIFYDDSDDVPRDKHTRVVVNFPDWKLSLGEYTFDPPLVFENGVTLKGAEISANHHKLVLICGELVKW